MFRLLAPFVLALSMIGIAAGADAACYADYKAKTDDPLRLHYGVIRLPAESCSVGAARSVIAARIGADGWTLLNVLSVFDDSGLEERKANAGQYFLRY
ncbi:hypothetical protein [Oceaniglobus trochenteri]|uniref:hypothetical protein n=1 Tax=Oceaniglobus trochenteri TaxID=2763260 RepID=UPI001CFFE32C|nr:hypothetical protein [Oceaniglobus trochenteri]